MVLFGIPGSPTVTQHGVCVLSSRLCFFIVANSELYVNSDDSLTSKRVIMRTSVMVLYLLVSDFRSPYVCYAPIFEPEDL